MAQLNSYHKPMLELNNNHKETACFKDKQESIQLICTSQKGNDDGKRSDSAVFDVNQFHISAASNSTHRTFQKAGDLLDHKPLEKSLLSQLKTKTKLKRSRKPYQVPERMTSSSITHIMTFRTPHCSSSSLKRSLSLTQRRHSGTNLVSSDWLPTLMPINRTPRSKSLDDIPSLTSSHVLYSITNANSPQNNSELNDMSNCFSKLDLANS